MLKSTSRSSSSASSHNRIDDKMEKEVDEIEPSEEFPILYRLLTAKTEKPKNRIQLMQLQNQRLSPLQRRLNSIEADSSFGIFESHISSSFNFHFEVRPSLPVIEDDEDYQNDDDETKPSSTTTTRQDEENLRRLLKRSRTNNQNNNKEKVESQDPISSTTTSTSTSAPSENRDGTQEISTPASFSQQSSEINKKRRRLPDLEPMEQLKNKFSKISNNHNHRSPPLLLPFGSGELRKNIGDLNIPYNNISRKQNESQIETNSLAPPAAPAGSLLSSYESYSCNQCDLKFDQSFLLKRHKQDVHGKDDEKEGGILYRLLNDEPKVKNHTPISSINLSDYFMARSLYESSQRPYSSSSFDGVSSSSTRESHLLHRSSQIPNISLNKISAKNEKSSYLKAALEGRLVKNPGPSIFK